MIKYQTFLRDATGGSIYELLPISISFKDKLNRESTASFRFTFRQLEIVAETYGTNVVDMFSSELREIYVTRNDVKIFYGVVSDVSADPQQDGNIGFTVKAVSFFGMFGKRIVGIPVTTYTATDAGAIAWDLIDDSQNSDSPYSDWGITQGSITTSVNRDRTYKFDNIKDAIIKLSNENLDNGFDFEIDTNKDFNVYYPTKGSSKPNIIFDERNLSGWSWTKPVFLQLTNKVYSLGESQGESPLYETRTAGTSYRTPFGTLEGVIKEDSIKVAATLQAKGDLHLELYREPIVKFTARHFDSETAISWSDYDLGDTIKVNLPRIGMSTVSKRVKERDFTLNDNTGVGEISILVE